MRLFCVFHVFVYVFVFAFALAFALAFVFAFVLALALFGIGLGLGYVVDLGLSLDLERCNRDRQDDVVYLPSVIGVEPRDELSAHQRVAVEKALGLRWCLWRLSCQFRFKSGDFRFQR